MQTIAPSSSIVAALTVAASANPAGRAIIDERHVGVQRAGAVRDRPALVRAPGARVDVDDGAALPVGQHRNGPRGVVADPAQRAQQGLHIAGTTPPCRRGDSHRCPVQAQRPSRVPRLGLWPDGLRRRLGCQCARRRPALQPRLQVRDHPNHWVCCSINQRQHLYAPKSGRRHGRSRANLAYQSISGGAISGRFARSGTRLSLGALWDGRALELSLRPAALSLSTSPSARTSST